jgi:hypothetical protein
VPAAIVGNDPVTVSQEKHHLGVPVVGGKGPAVVEEERLTGSPVLIEDLGTVLRRNSGHERSPYFISTWFENVVAKSGF